MLRDVFYYGNKPNVHPREKFAKDLNDARRQSTTDHFWIINEFCDYKNFDWDFDFDFLPDEDVWASEHNNIWPSQHQKDSGTWLCTKDNSEVLIYRNDVDVVPRKKEKTENWILLDTVDETKFDFSWHPDPTDPPYIYRWGCIHYPVEIQAVLEYRVPGATKIKYMNTVAPLLPQHDCWKIYTEIDKDSFDFTWRPDPREPAYIYIWGNKYVPAELQPTLEYHCPGATDKKYIKNDVKLLPEWDRWIEHLPVDKIRTQETGFDFTWRPDPREPAYNYVWGNKYEPAEIKPTLEYRMPGATQIKYMDNCIEVLPEWDRWENIEHIDKNSFDFSWRPNPLEPNMIFQFGTQHQKTGGPRYVCLEATEIKYINSQVAKILPNKNNQQNFKILYNYKIAEFDYSWHPDETDDPYIYVFGNQYYDGETMPTIEYHVKGATQRKYVSTIKAKLGPDKTFWLIPNNIDTSDFDFSWKPNPFDPPYIYKFGTQWQRTGGPEYWTPDATEVKYIDFQKAKALPDKKKWTIPKNIDQDSFDFSWHPDDGDPAYVYHFGTQWQKDGGPMYIVPGAVEAKYVDLPTAKATTDKTNWEIPDNIDVDNFDFSWHPSIEDDQPYIYQFGTQWQKTGGPRYISPGVIPTSPVKYVDRKIMHSNILPSKKNWHTLFNYKIAEFDYSWHPDETDDPYIYVFGNQYYPGETMPTIEYHVKGATQRKYINDINAKLGPDRTFWLVPENVDVSDFDFSWKPNPFEPPYIYKFGTQWQRTGGPEYWTPEATEVKYMDLQKAKALPNKKKWTIPKNIDQGSFDFSWHPDDSEPPYVYHFGTQWQKDGGPMYIVAGATEAKYIDFPTAKAIPDRTNWEIPEFIDTDSFDFSWHPSIEDDQPYIYQVGTQWQKTGGPRYISPGVIPTSPVKYIDRKIVQSRKLPSKKNWHTLFNYKIAEFDYSWHPDDTEEPYIYVFGNQYYNGETMPTIEYHVKGAKKRKYVNDVNAKLGPDRTFWLVPENVDVSDFDFSWKPNPFEPPYIYKFGTQWQKTGGPEYWTPDATEIKYMDLQKAKALPRSNDVRWQIPEGLDISEFDFSWHPDDTDKPYIYQFGTQWALTGGPRFVIPEATEIKYIEEPVAKAAPNKTHWEIPDDIDVNSFDFSWHPYTEDDPFIYQFGTQWQKTGGPKYHTPGTDEMSATKFIDPRVLKATKLPKPKNFVVEDGIAIKDFDYSWHPDETDGPYIYIFGNNKYPAEIMPTVKYIVPGATKIKYINDVKATLAPNMSKWTIPNNIDTSSFDFSWVPNPNDPPYIYEFGTQWQKTGGPRYTVKDATEVKYVADQKATIKSIKNDNKWQTLVTITSFDYSWHPDSTEEPYIYVFGNKQYPAEIMPTIKYVVPGATELKYINDVKAVLSPDMSKWTVPDNIDTNSFDFSWVPNPNDPPYIYEFATVWNNRGGPKYTVKDATEYKYIEDIKAALKPSKQNWEIPKHIDISDFDFSWVPHPEAPPYIYQFGTLEDDNDGPRYITPNNNGEVVRLLRVYKNNQETNEIPKYYIKTTLENLVNEHINEVFWALQENIDYTNFNFEWRPNIEQARYVHVFGSPESEITQTYFVSGPMYNEGYKDFNFVEQDKKASEEYLAELFVQPDIFLVDRGNPETQERFEQLKVRFPNVSKTRFLNSWVDTINRCINRSNTELCWILNSELDYSNFDFKYYPNQWQMKMVHVFGTQWSHWGTTYMVNRETFSEDTKYIKIVEHLNNLNFVKDRRAIATNNIYDIVLIDHGNKEINEVSAILEKKSQGKKVIVVKYEDSYFNTIKKLVDKVSIKKENYVWICSSVCDYRTFDFSYICDPFARDHLHVFPSEKQKFGDTFLLDINKTKEIINDIDILQAYHKVNYNQHQRVKRLPAPIINVVDDTHVNVVKQDFDFPYAIFKTEDVNIEDQEPMNLWTEDTKNILVTTTGATRIIVPKEAKDYVEKELYDYPYIKTASKLGLSKPLDIVFLSNGEKCADENYEHLLAVTKGLKNRVVRVDGVNGRVEAYHAALQASQTKWAFTVFAKLKVDTKFDWGWQPDRLQIPKHYIFHAKNPLNNLEYGHQGMIAYNQKLTLNNFGDGLDFTLDDPHETVRILSGVANFNTDAYSTWRTAFREVIKLKSDYTDISQERLKIWLTKAKGKFAQDCLQGANDAVEYYDSVSGDIDQLKLSYEWDWLKEFYNRKYK
jgi:hypothetical protein